MNPGDSSPRMKFYTESEAGYECAATVQSGSSPSSAIVLTAHGGMDPLPLVATLNIPRFS